MKPKSKSKGKIFLLVMLIIFAFPAVGLYYFVKYRSTSYSNSVKRESLKDDLINGTISDKEYDKKISALNSNNKNY